MWINYNKATPEQQAIFREINPQLAPDYDRYQMLIVKSGEVCRRKGWWRWTTDYANQVDADTARMVRERYEVRSKGDLREWKPGVTFSFSRD